jgi:hypothetical protein
MATSVQLLVAVVAAHLTDQALPHVGSKRSPAVAMVERAAGLHSCDRLETG